MELPSKSQLPFIVATAASGLAIGWSLARVLGGRRDPASAGTIEQRGSSPSSTTPEPGIASTVDRNGTGGGEESSSSTAPLTSGDQSPPTAVAHDEPDVLVSGADLVGLPASAGSDPVAHADDSESDDGGDDGLLPTPAPAAPRPPSPHAIDATPRGASEGFAEPQQLFVFFDLESTGLSTLDDEITQLAAVADGYPDLSFVSYVRTDRKIPARVTEHTRISAETIRDAPRFREVFLSFAGWLVSVAARAAEDHGHSCRVRPVIVAHNGKAFDFPLLMQEMERHGLPLGIFSVMGVSFGDSLPFLRALKKSTDAELKASADLLTAAGSLSLPKLFPALFGGEAYEAHDALADVVALGRVLFQSPLDRCPAYDALLGDHVRTAWDVVNDFREERTRKMTKRSWKRLVTSEGKKVVGGVILSRLEETGLSYNDFVAMARRLGADALKAELRRLGITRLDAKLDSLVAHFVDKAADDHGEGTSSEAGA